MRKTVGMLAAVLFGLGGVLVAGSPANAATPSLRFHGAQYDSPGKDTRSNASRNAEWISLINSGRASVNLNGYTIRDKAGKVYRFGNVTIAGNGGRLWLHTGSGRNAGRDLYWNSGNYIWNNTGDTAYLRNAKGGTVDSCSWGNKKNRTWVGC
ncbi:lamin tail domain-containing protein [Micromonospora sonneratiae]|uniref:Lamin tail domain-containing protein n=1 Tax=Micromonospora sonneratiae TaxID=1184706 RepID=A0ABW3Y960_9ACTN